MFYHLDGRLVWLGLGLVHGEGKKIMIWGGDGVKVKRIVRGQSYKIVIEITDTAELVVLRGGVDLRIKEQEEFIRGLPDYAEELKQNIYYLAALRMKNEFKKAMG